MLREDIMKIIPHRDPFLLLDEIVELIPEKSVNARLTLTGDEYFFKGHFPGMPVMPGVLIVEAMAQAGAVVILSMPEFKGKIGYFAGIEKARFKKKVFPGDTLELFVEITNRRGSIGFGKGTATVCGKLAAFAEITFAIGE